MYGKGMYGKACGMRGKKGADGQPGGPRVAGGGRGQRAGTRAWDAGGQDIARIPGGGGLLMHGGIQGTRSSFVLDPAQAAEDE